MENEIQVTVSNKDGETKKPKFLKKVLYYFEDFCSKTSIHGFVFLGESQRSVTEKIWWLIIISVAFTLCTWEILITYRTWIESPVVVTFATDQTPIWEIPFPSVTICPEVKCEVNSFNFTAVYIDLVKNNTVSEETKKHFEYMSLICLNFDDVISDTWNVSDLNAINYILKVAPKMESVLIDVKWRGERYSKPSKLFTNLLVSEGLCFSFNILPKNHIYTNIIDPEDNTENKNPEWTIEEGYFDNADMHAYPHRTFISGVKGGLDLILRVDKQDLDYVCGTALQGFKVVLHTPMENPRVKQKFFRVPLDQAVLAVAKPILMTTSDDLLSYDPNDRQCYVPNEKPLQHYKIYTQTNCLSECLSDYTYSTCGCVPFYMPRNSSTPICGSYLLDCVETSKALFAEEEEDEHLDNNEEKSPLCGCLPSCHSLNFEVDTYNTRWHYKDFLQVKKQTHSWNSTQNEIFINRSHLSKLSIYYKDMQIITSERNELYGTVEFWANCGGIIGLFSGFSFMSLFEIIYFLSLRLICNVRMYGAPNWQGNSDK